MADLPAPTHKTPMGVTVWLTGGGRCLLWSGDHDKVRVASVTEQGDGGIFVIDQPPWETVSGRCEGLGEAQRAVAAWLAREVSGG